jgi:hypothetical protein
VRFLAEAEVVRWCETHGIDADGEPVGRASEGLVQVVSGVYADGRRGTAGPSIAFEIVGALGAWSEALLWIRAWGVWPSSEDWPAFYALRGDLGEARELRVAPGAVFERTDADSLAAFLAQVLLNAWDVTMIALDDAGTPSVILTVSHDEWLEIRSREAMFLPAQVRPILDR